VRRGQSMNDVLGLALCVWWDWNGIKRCHVKEHAHSRREGGGSTEKRGESRASSAEVKVRSVDGRGSMLYNRKERDNGTERENYY